LAETVLRSIGRLPPRALRAAGGFFFAMAIIFGGLTLALLGGLVFLHWQPVLSGLAILILNIALALAFVSIGKLLRRLAKEARVANIGEPQVRQKLSPRLVNAVGHLRPGVLRFASLVSITLAISVSIFAFVRLSRVLVHWDSPSDGLTAAGLGLAVCVLLGALGWILWQSAASVEQQSSPSKIERP
jgi:hypothetical protein